MSRLRVGCVGTGFIAGRHLAALASFPDVQIVAVADPADGRAAEAAGRYGALVDLHAHFLTGDPSWFTEIIEPSLVGASEVRRCFLDHVLA